MGAKANQNTNDHYKINGKGPSGENILHDVNKQQFAQSEAAQEDNGLIPGQNEQARQHHQQTPAPKGGEKRGGSSTPSSNSSSSDY